VRENSKGRPNARRDAAPEERYPGRTKGAPEPTESYAKLPEGEPRRKAVQRRLPQSLEAGPTPHEEWNQSHRFVSKL